MRLQCNFYEWKLKQCYEWKAKTNFTTLLAAAFTIPKGCIEKAAASDIHVLMQHGLLTGRQDQSMDLALRATSAELSGLYHSKQSIQRSIEELFLKQQILQVTF